MKYIPALIQTMILLIYAGVAMAAAKTTIPQMPPLETVVVEPVSIENISIWVPAAKSGPLINRSCRPKENCTYSSVLPACVRHTKTDCCPPEVARLLAENVAVFHQERLPLTMFNGWQWEYSYSLCQFDLVTYDLAKRGGSWENSWEAILTLSWASDGLGWVAVPPLPKVQTMPSNNDAQSIITVTTFSGMRTRDGYPKERQL